MPSAAFDRLRKIISKLRSGKGCPWDRKQTIQSLQKCLEDEMQEVKEAIEANDNKNLKEELGDLLFTTVMMIQIAEEEKIFSLKEVLEESEKKLIERHTWVFGDDKASTAEEAYEMWQRNKKK
ncbi:nucleotide pyrophosphohydrolase [Patescibacteria group bacterium]|nr:nucleotide pyrophosphohydrolase [Patescibacteria group bacterium]